MMKHQIDYQKMEFQIPNGYYQREIPLPMNCILKSVNVEKLNSLGGAGMIQAQLKLIDTDVNSNIRVEHTLAMGGINAYAYVHSSAGITYWNKTLSYLYDHPIQKEGIALQLCLYNETDNSAKIVIHWQVKNLEGGI